MLGATADATAQDKTAPGFFDTFIAHHLELGTRISCFMLEDEKRTGDDSFYGSITELRAMQNYIPYKFFADYKINNWWGFELAWDRVQAGTITRSDGHNDGTIDVHGPMLSIFGRYANASPIEPYAGIGLGYFFVDFHEDSIWHQPRGEFEQSFYMEDSWGWIAYAGLDVLIIDRWHADLLIRHMEVNADGTHYQTSPAGGDEYPTSSFSFPMSNDSVSLGLRYAL